MMHPNPGPGHASYGGAGPSYLINQNFETPTTGFDNGESWTTSGTVDPVYTTTPLVGSQSLHLVSGSNFVYSTFTGQTNCWAFCVFRFTTNSTSDLVFSITNNPVTTHYCAMTHQVSGAQREVKLTTRSGGTASASALSGFALSVNTTYYCWLHFVSGGTCELFVSSTTTRTATDSSSNCYVTNSSDSVTAGAIFCFSGNSGDMIYDHILVDDASIGNNP